jgi:Protein of unknown function (DUF3574)
MLHVLETVSIRCGTTRSLPVWAPAWMRRRLVPALALAVVLAACVPGPQRLMTVDPQTGLLRCRPQTLSRLYFGFDTPNGPVTELAWQGFVQDEIAPRLPGGFTLLAATGQWQDSRGVTRQEASRVLELVGDDGAEQRQALAEIVARYKTRFRQQSVLATHSPTRACG